MDKFPQHPNVIELSEFKRRFSNKSPSRLARPPAPAALPDPMATCGSFLEDLATVWQTRLAASVAAVSSRIRAGESLTAIEIGEIGNLTVAMETAKQEVQGILKIVEHVNASLDHYEAALQQN